MLIANYVEHVHVDEALKWFIIIYVSWNALIAGYAESVGLWTALISGYVEHEHDEEALICFEPMKIHGISPDVITYIRILKALGKVEALEKGM